MNDTSAKVELFSPDTLTVELWYPRSRPVQFIELDLIDTRAADTIRISYDFNRDGWLVEQRHIAETKEGGHIADLEWKEAAFCPAWQFVQQHQEQTHPDSLGHA